MQDADGKLGQAFVWNGAVWRLSQAGTNFIGDKAIGSAQIGDASIGSAQIADASITDAKIGGLSVSKLMVTGGAKMPQAVIDVITSDSAFLGAVAAHSVSVDPENMVREPLFASSPSSVWTVSDARAVTLAATVSGAPGALATGVRFVNPAGAQTWAQVTQKIAFPAGKRWVLRMTYRYNSGHAGTLVATAQGLPCYGIVILQDGIIAFTKDGVHVVWNELPVKTVPCDKHHVLGKVIWCMT